MSSAIAWRQSFFNVERATRICACYGLGVPTTAPMPVTGGLIHQMFRLDTDLGRFAVKVLAPDILRRPGARDAFCSSERIAAAFSALGVPAVLALAGPDGTVQDIDGQVVIVFPWCDGATLPRSDASPHHARTIGSVLGRIHAFDLRLPEEERKISLPPREPMIEADWEQLIGQAKNQGVSWAAAMEEALPKIFLWERAAREAEWALPPTLVISHGDLDQKNVLWCDGDTPAIIDWESAGPVRPAVELIGAALDWSGQGVGPPERAAFVAILEGYRQEAEFLSELALPALQCRLGDWLDWLVANMRRSLDGQNARHEEVVFGTKETTETLALMYRLARGMETWGEWCER